VPIPASEARNAMRENQIIAASTGRTTISRLPALPRLACLFLSGPASTKRCSTTWQLCPRYWCDIPLVVVHFWAVWNLHDLRRDFKSWTPGSVTSGLSLKSGTRSWAGCGIATRRLGIAQISQQVSNFIVRTLNLIDSVVHVVGHLHASGDRLGAEKPEENRKAKVRQAETLT